MTNQLSKSGRRQFWEDHIAWCAASGLNQVEYCRSNKISVLASITSFLGTRCYDEFACPEDSATLEGDPSAEARE